MTLKGWISIGDAPRELRAAALAARAASRDVRNQLYRNVRETMKPVWTSGLEAHMSQPRDVLLVAGAKVQAGNPPSLVTATTKKKVGGLIANQNWAGFEWGANRAQKHIYERTYKGGKTGRVERAVLAGHPQRRRVGRVISPTVRQILPRIASLWVQTVVRTYMDAIEGQAS